jgi:hypothetical protein
MSGVLIKGTIQVQDTESIVAKNTGVLASNTSYIDEYLCTWVQGIDEASLAVSITNALNDQLTDGRSWTVLSINTNIQGTNHSAFITWVRLKVNW